MSAIDPSAPGLPLVGSGGGATLPDTPAAVLLDVGSPSQLVALDVGGAGSAIQYGDAFALGAVASIGAEAAGTAIIADGAGDVATTSAAVSAMLAAGTAGAALSALGGAATVTTTRGDLIRRGASADERVALGASGTVLTSDGTDPVWSTPAISISSGVDTSRPAATSAGMIYTTTDTDVAYLSESDGVGGFRWRCMSSGLLDRAYMGITVSTQAPLGVTSRAAPVSSGTVVLFFGGRATPTGIVGLAGNFGYGFQLEMGNETDKGLVTFYRSGVTPTRAVITGATITGGLSTMHALAISLTSSAARWSWDGGAVQSQAYTGTPNGSGPYWVGAPGAAYDKGLYSAFRVLGETASDGDLVTLTDATARATWRIPAVASAPTIVVDWHASRAAMGAMVRRLIGTQPDLMYSSTPPRGGSW